MVTCFAVLIAHLPERLIRPALRKVAYPLQAPRTITDCPFFFPVTPELVPAPTPFSPRFSDMATPATARSTGRKRLRQQRPAPQPLALEALEQLDLVLLVAAGDQHHPLLWPRRLS